MKNSNIEWTDHTINFWWGCTKVGPGCDNCYAETLSNRFNQPSLWGVGANRKRMPNAAKNLAALKSGWVFIQSMSDIGDTEVPLEWFAEAWASIKANPQVNIQIVTKRLPVLLRRLVAIGETSWPSHAGLMITVVNQTEADRDIPLLIAAKSKWDISWVGLSIEPMLGPIELYTLQVLPASNAWVMWTKHLDWIVCGGESGGNARPVKYNWVTRLRDQCSNNGVPFFFKQWGEFVPADDHDVNDRRVMVDYYNTKSPAFESTATHPITVIVGVKMWRVGKNLAGRTLDGATHNAMPRITT